MCNKKFNFICRHCGAERKDMILFEREKEKMIRCYCSRQTTLQRDDVLGFLKIKKNVLNKRKVLDIYRYELALNYSKPIIISNFMFKT